MSLRMLARKPANPTNESLGSSSSLKLSKPGDTFEREADRVADTVVSGSRVPAWSIAKVDTGQEVGTVQRDTPDGSTQQQSTPKPNNYDEAAQKILEAFLQTDAGKKLMQAIQNDPLAKDAQAFVTSTPGIVISGAAAAGTVAGLAAAHKPLPAQIPAIPLDKVIPALKGVKAQINIQGPLDKPTQITIGFSGTFGGGNSSEKKKKDDPSARIQADKQALQQSMDMFKPKGKGMGPSDDVAELMKLGKGAETLGLEDFGARRPFAPLPGTQGVPLGPAQPAAPQAGTGLQLPSLQSPFRPKTPQLLDKQLELKPLDAPQAANAGKDAQDKDKKREEIPAPVQRKAAACEPVFASGEALDEGLRSSSRPLDSETRSYMESRFGRDFGKVKIHTGDAASRSARALGAMAYTVGKDVVFDAARFSPGSAQGRRLLAHELTHVVQQTQPAAKTNVRPMPVQRAPLHIQRDEEESSGSWLHPIETLKAKIRKIPGYKLFTVILAEDPLTGEKVVRDASSLASGVLDLVPGGKELYDRIMESGAVQKVFDWLNHELDSLGLSWDYVRGLIHQIRDSVHASDVFDLDGAFQRVIGILSPAYEKLKQFAKDAFDKACELIVEVVMDRLGGAKILEILKKAGGTFLKIVKDPVGFLGNLVRSLAQGFNQFKDNILDHLKNGVVEWLFGAIESAGIKLPKKFDLAGIVNLVLQVLGLSWSMFRKKLVGLIGEKAVGYLETAFDFIVQIAQAKDLSVIWKMILEKADQLIDSVLDSVKQWAISKIVTTAIVKLATMFNPVGAVVQAIETIYHTITFFVEKAKQLASLIEAITDSVSAIAEGNLTQAANFVERSMAKAIPPILGFLAELIGLGGIGEQLHKVIESIHEKVGKAIDRVLDWVVSKFKALYAKAKDAVGEIIAWWQQRKEIKIGQESHSVFIEGTEDQPHLMIASVPGVRWSEYFKDKKPPEGKEALFAETKKMADDVEQRLKPSGSDEEKAQRIEEKRQLFNKIADNIQALGFSGEQEAPASVIKYGGVNANGGGSEADAPVLSRNHPPGTEPSDEPPIWTRLGSLTQKKHYVQGHLLNHNLGGEGRRFNLSPINKKANSDHLNQIERTVKKAVNQDKKVVSYTVKAVYGTHSEKPKRYLELKAAASGQQPLDPQQKQELGEYEAEQQLCTTFDFEMSELAFTQGKWTKLDGSTKTGSVKNTIEG